MSWKIAPHVADILKKGAGFGGISREEALALMKPDLHTREVYALMQTADQMSREQFGGKGENHLHIGVNIEPCPFDCGFCSLTRQAGIFTEKIEFSEAEILAWAREAESRGADALNVMTTGTFSFERLLEIGRLLKKTVTTPLVANTRDASKRTSRSICLARGGERTPISTSSAEGFTNTSVQKNNPPSA